MSKEVWFTEINEECGYGVDQEGDVRHVDDETTAPPIDETPSLNSDWSKRRNSFLENAAKSVGQYKMAVGAKASYGINSKVTNAYEDLGSIQERIVSNRKKAKKYGEFACASCIYSGDCGIEMPDSLSLLIALKDQKTRQRFVDRVEKADNDGRCEDLIKPGRQKKSK